jgi:hypothetical protein
MNTTALKNPVYLALVQARFQLTEAVRIPISIIMGLFAPSIGLLFFVIPQRTIAQDPELATAAVIGLAVFGMMVNSLFQFAIEVSQARERPWGAYTRTLPSGAGSRLLSYLLSSGVLSAVSVIPLVVLAALTTEATLSVPRLLTQHCSSPHHSHPVHAHRHRRRLPDEFQSSRRRRASTHAGPGLRRRSVHPTARLPGMARHCLIYHAHTFSPRTQQLGREGRRHRLPHVPPPSASSPGPSD